MRSISKLALALLVVFVFSCSKKDKAPLSVPAVPAAPAVQPGEEEFFDDDDEPQEAPVVAAPGEVEDKKEQPEPHGIEVVNALVARVNGKDVDASEHFRRLARISKKTTERFDGKDLARSTVDRLINDILIKEELEKHNQVVTDEEVAEAMGLDMVRFAQAADKMDTRIASEREKLAVNKLLNSRGFLDEPTEADLEEEYGKRRMIRLNVVNFRVPLKASETEEMSAKSKADDFLAAVTDGKDFRETAKEMTDEKLGRRAVRPMIVRDGEPRHKEMWEAALKLEEGGMGGPIRTQFGWAVFEVVKKIEPRYAFDEMKERLSKTVQSQKSIQAKKRLVNELRKDAQIEYLMDFGQASRPNLVGPKAKAHVARLRAGEENPISLRGHIPDPDLEKQPSLEMNQEEDQPQEQ